MDAQKLAQLRKIAENQRAAHAGPYKRGAGYEQSDRGNYVADAMGRIIAAEQDDTDCVLDDKTAEYLAAFDPETILALIERVEIVVR